MKIKNSDLFDSIPSLLSSLFETYEYPYEIISSLASALKALVENPPDGFSVYKDGVIIGSNVTIEEGATIMPPAVICDGATLRQGAYIRGNAFIGNGAVVGHSTELKNSIMMEGAQAPHFNYVGDSILGKCAHIGAGAILSNLKADKSPITIKGDTTISTGMRKLGSIIGDGGEVGCGAVLNPGSIIGKNSTVYPLVSWRGILDENSIAKTDSVVTKKT